MAEVSLGWNNARLQAGARGAEAIVSRTAASMQSNLRKVGSMNWGQGMATMFAGYTFGSAAKSILEITAEYDSLKRGLLTVEGTQERVTDRLRELKDVAALPGLGMTEAIQGDIRLRSVGLSADLSRRSLIEMGNALAIVGGGKADLDGVLLALTQIVSKGKVSAEEINQIAERVPQVRAVMQEAFGTADTEAIQKLGISSERFIETLVEGFERKIPRATGGLKNSMEVLGDSFKEMIIGFGEPIGEVLIPQFRSMSQIIEANSEGIKELGRNVSIAAEAGMEMYKGVIAVGGGMAAWMDGASFTEEVATQWRNMHRDVDGVKEGLDGIKAAGGNGSAGTSSGGFTPGPDLEAQKEAAKTMREIEEARLRLGEKQFDVFMSHTSPLLQSEALLKRIKDLQEEAAGRDGPVHELERIKMLEKIIELQNRERAVRKQANEEAERAKEKQAEEAKQAKEVDDRRRQELARLDAELAIIEAQNAGLQKKAEMMRRNLEIAEQAARIQERTGISQAEAIKKATALVDGQNKANAAGDGKRQGTAAERQEAARQRQADRQSRAEQERRDSYKRNFPGLNEWKAKQGKPLRGEFSFPGLDQYNAMQDRNRPVGAPMPAANGKPAATQEMPTVENLLQQLINTTESLKEG